MRALLVVLLFVGTFALPALAAPPGCGPYRVAYYEFGSLYYKTEAGDFVGIDRDIVQELARRSGCQLDGFLDSRIRTWMALADGSLAMSVSGIATPEREQFAHFLPYFHSRNYVLLRKEAAAATTMRAFLDEGKWRLAVVKSFKHGPVLDAWVDALRAQKRVDEYADAEVVARIFAVGRADAFISQPVVWGPLLKRNGLEDKLLFRDWASADTIVGSLVLSRKLVRPEDVVRIRTELDAMRQDGTTEAIFARHLAADLARKLVP